MRRPPANAAALTALAALLLVAPRAQAQSTTDGSTLIERMQRATVQVLCEESWGSGFAVGSARTVVTNAHVVEECAGLRVRAWDGSTAAARVLVVDPDRDVAVLAVDGTLGISTASLRADGEVKVGEEVFAVGFPGVAQKGDGNMMVQSPEARVTRGPVSRSAYPQRNGERFLLDHSAGIYHGNSGGPLFDACGRVVGVNTEGGVDQGGQFYGTVGFAVGSRTISDVLRKAGTEAALATGGCTVGLGTLVGATVAAAKKGTPEAQAVAAQLEAKYRKFQKTFDAQWDSLQLVVAQGDSAETARARGAEESLAGLLNSVQDQLNRDIAGATKRLDGLEQRINDYQKENNLWRYVLAGALALVAVAVVVVMVKQRKDRAGVSEVRRDVRQQGEQVDALGEEARRLRDQLREHEQRLQELASRQVAKLEAADPKGARDARGVMGILQETPGFLAQHMSDDMRTMVARTVRAQGDAPATVLDRGEALVTQMARTQKGGVVARLIARDGATGQPRELVLPAGASAYIGRDEATLRAVASRFPLAPVVVPMGAGDGRVSRCHLSISNEGDGIRITDLSLNGTYAGAPLTRIARGSQPVEGGRRNRPDLLELGDTTKVTDGAVFTLARPDSGLTIEVHVQANTSALQHSNN